MKKSLVLVFCLLLLPAGVMAQTGAELSLLVFRAGQPVSGVAVFIAGKHTATTNRFGGAHIALTAGEHELVLKSGSQTLVRLRVNAESEAAMEAIVTVFDDGRAPRVDIEGASGGMAGTGASAGDSQKQPATETSLVAGRVVSTETGKPVVNARVFASGTDRQTQTDSEGRFELELPVGTYALSIIHPEFSTQTLSDVQVIGDETTTLALELTPTGVELQEFIVTAPYIEGSVASIVAQQRQGFSVSEVLGAEQMAQSGDSDAADALQRVTGLTVEDGKFVQIRGLPTRYTKSLWNGSELPSPDPNRRVVPLDLFPTGVLKSVQVQKTYSPGLPGSFGGGLLQLETRGVPEDAFLELSVSSGYNSETTFKKGLTYEGGGLDFLGIDDGTRELPGALNDALSGDRELAPVSLSNPNGFTGDELEQLGESLPNIYEIDKSTLGPDMGLSLTGGNRFQVGSGNLGFLGSLVYSRDWTQRSGPENSFGLSGDELIPRDQFDETQTEMGVTLGGMFTLAAQTAENHSVTSNTFVIRKTTDTARIRDGLRAENDDTVRESTLEWVERQLLTEQLVGAHTFPGLHDLSFDWRAMYSQGKRYSPDRRFYRYILQNNQFVFEESSLSRRYAELNDDTLSFDADLSLPLGDEERVFTLLKTGAHYSNKKRDSEIETFQFEWEQGSIPFDIVTQSNPEDIFSGENIAPDQFVIDDLTGANDDYRGTQKINALYFMADTRLYNLLRFNGGVRSEWAELDVKTFQASAGGGENAVQSTLKTSSLLPALTATWYMSDNMQLRLGYGKTVSRPDLKELSAASYIDPVTGDEFVGQPDLEETSIDNFDIRWEWYPSETESLTLGAFWKDFTNPIETVKIPGFNAPRSFQNADEATNLGIELGFRKGFAFLGESWQDVYLSANGAWIDSEVKLADTNFTNTNKTRALQGQAPYIVNFKLGYDGASTDATLLYNIVGERISEVGIQGQPDIKEQPAPQIDFILSQQLTKAIKLKFSARNLLNPKTEFLQGDEVQRSYRKGREFGLSVSWEM